MIRDPRRLEDLLADVRRFVRDVAIPNEDRVAEQDEIPAEIVDEMRARGYFGWSIPEEHGGAGLTTEELALANIEVSRCSVAYRARVGMNTGIGSESLIQDGTEEQKRRYLPRLASGEITGCLALTEPEAGSDATALQTTAVRDGDGHYRISGRKRYITLAPIADLFTVFARSAGGRRLFPGITADRLGRLASGYGKAFSRYIRKIGVKGDEQVSFHSFRYAFADGCVVRVTAMRRVRRVSDTHRRL